MALHLLLFISLGLSTVIGQPVNAVSQLDLPPTGNPSECPAGTHFIRQPIWHPEASEGQFNVSTIASNRTLNSSTFLQQYEIITDHFKSGGPIFFFQGDEASINCLETLQFYEWAEEFGALLVAIEHRFFGISIPFGLSWADNLQWPTHVLEPLTLKNVQYDSIKLLEMIKGTVSGAKDSPVIVFGGSYSGALATFHRVQFPDIFYGAVGSAAPFNYASDPRSPGTYIWGDWISRVYYDLSTETSAKIKNAMNYLRSRLEQGKFDGLKDSLNLCTSPNSTAIGNHLLWKVFYSFSTVAQYGWNFYDIYNEPIVGLEYVAKEVSKISDDDPLAVLKVATDLQAVADNLTCLDWAPSRVLGRTDGLPFQWIWCFILPFAMPQTRSDTIFGNIEVSEGQPRINDPICQRAFGMNAMEGGPEYAKKLGVDPENLRKTERLTLWYGGVDPASALGAASWLWNAGGSANCSHSVFATNLGHCQDLQLSKANDTEALNATRHYERESIKEWLGMV